MYLEKEEMKFAAVYAIKHYKAPVSEDYLYRMFIWDQEILEYFDLAAVLMELQEDGYITKKFYRNQEAFCLTESGEAAYRYFKNRIPFSIRERIDTAIGETKYDELVDPSSVSAEVILAAEDQYMAKCTIFENRTPMLELNINMGTRNQAQRVANYFKDNSKKIYEEVLKLCVEDNK